MIKSKVWNELDGDNWILLGHYHTRYPSDWKKTIERCLDNPENRYEFKYDSSCKLTEITIVCPGQNYGSDWNFHVVFDREK